MNILRISVTLFFIFILACSSHPEPDWLFSQPHEEGYWIGIGIVEKPTHGDDCREIATAKALADISAQISVEVTGSFKRVVTENNLSLDDYSRSIMQTRVNKNLPSIEYVDFYDSKEKCSRMARLSQSVYYETIKRQRRNAVQSSLELLTLAESDFNFQTFAYINEAMNEIIPYLDEPIHEEYPLKSKKFVNLYAHIKVVANQSMNRLNLVPDKEKLEVKLGFMRDLQLNVQVRDKRDDSPIENIPVTCYLKDKKENLSALSDVHGKCIFSMPAMIDKDPIQYVNYEVNMGEILQSSELFGALSQIQAQSTLHVNAPMIYIHVIENNLGSPNDNPYVQPVINQFFARNFSAKFVDAEQADLLISGTVNTRSSSDAPNEFGIYQVFGDMTISMSNGKTGEKLLEKSFNNIQGSAFQSNREAANQSIRKISEKITEDFLPEIVDLIKDL